MDDYPNMLSPQRLRELADGVANANADAERISRYLFSAIKTADPEREKKVEALVSAAEDAMIDLKDFWRRHYDESGFTRSTAQSMAESATTVRKLRHALHSLKGGENG